MKKLKKRINLLLLLAAAFIFFRFLVCTRGESAESEYLWSYPLFEGVFLGVYRFYAGGMPFFGISVGGTPGSTVKYLLPAPIFSGDEALCEWSVWDFSAVIFICLLVVLLNKRKRPYYDDDDGDEYDDGEDTSDEAREDEPREAPEKPNDKSLCPKCGSRIFGDNMYCENCGAKRKE